MRNKLFIVYLLDFGRLGILIKIMYIVLRVEEGVLNWYGFLKVDISMCQRQSGVSGCVVHYF